MTNGTVVDVVFQHDLLFYGGLIVIFALALWVGLRQERAHMAHMAHMARMTEPPDMFDEIRDGWQAAERCAASGRTSSGFDFRRSEAWRQGYMLWVQHHISSPLRRGMAGPASHLRTK